MDYGDEMMHKNLCCLGEVPYCFPRSFIKFQGHTRQNIANLDPNWAFPDCNSSLNSPMDLKWCTKLDMLFRSSVKFQGPTSWKIDDLDPIWLRLLGQSHLSNPSDLPFLCFFFVSLQQNGMWTHEFTKIFWKTFENIYLHIDLQLWQLSMDNKLVETMTKDKNINKDMKMLYKSSSKIVRFSLNTRSTCKLIQSLFLQWFVYLIWPSLFSFIILIVFFSWVTYNL